MFLDATQFDDAYMYGYYGDELPKMQQIGAAYIPTSHYFYDISKGRKIIFVVPCSDGIVYFYKLPKELFHDQSQFVAEGPTAPTYPETPKGTNGPCPQNS